MGAGFACQAIVKGFACRLPSGAAANASDRMAGQARWALHRRLAPAGRPAGAP